MRIRRRACGFLSLILAMWLGNAVAAVVPPVLILSPEAIMPLELQGVHVLEPKAVVRILIAADGTVADAVCISASHQRMARRAEQVARNSTFEPAKENDAPIPVFYSMTIHFAFKSRASSFTTIVEDIDALSRHGFGDSEALTFCPAKDLDAPPMIASQPTPVLLKDQSGELRFGKAVIEGYIDVEGGFRLLRVVAADDHIVGEAATQTFADLKFHPLLHQGGPATTKVRVPFVARRPQSPES